MHNFKTLTAVAVISSWQEERERLQVRHDRLCDALDRTFDYTPLDDEIFHTHGERLFAGRARKVLC